VSIAKTLTGNCPVRTFAFSCVNQSTTINYKIYDNCSDLPTNWDSCLPNQSLLMQTPYLQAIEDANTGNLHYRYVHIEKDGELCGAAYFQIIPFKGKMGIEPKDSFFVRTIKNAINAKTFYVLVCGNSFLTGHYGFHYESDKINGTEAFKALNGAIEKLCADKSLNIHMIMAKDFPPAHIEAAKSLVDFKYTETKFQPNMSLDIRENWVNLDAYKADLLSKYRVRAKKILKKAAEIEVRILTPEEIRANRSIIYEYYREVVERAEFYLAKVNEDYFENCAKNMPENFFLKGYFLEGRLIGFITYFIKGGHLESHFIGYDTAVNRSHKLYNFILYDLLETALENGVKKLVYGRTAMEIKSTIGAEGVNMNAFLKLTNSFLNRFLSYFTKTLVDENWTPRNPLKPLPTA